MKNTKFLILIFVIAFSFACKKDSKITDIINPSASLKCKVNGVDWTAQTRLTTMQSNKFIINGTVGTSGSNILNITIFGANTGTYITVPTQFLATYTNDTGVGDSLYTSTEGTVTLSKVDTTNKRISGTFSFKAKNPQLLNKQITAGTFTDLAY